MPEKRLLRIAVSGLVLSIHWAGYFYTHTAGSVGKTEVIRRTTNATTYPRASRAK
jgi:hypothetical protein